MKKESLKITPLKGRPMLHWVGRKPLDVVKHYPAQLSEAFGVDKPPAEPTYADFRKRGCNLLFSGDNKEVLSSLLVAGFRGKIDLIYIDPPFDSGADYVRRVKLRGMGNGNADENGNGGKIPAGGQSLAEQTQYNDIWANDNYLQFMYERLILLQELLSEEGSIYLHCDWHKSHHLRFLLDEIFGQENFGNEIIWCYTFPGPSPRDFPKKHDNILRYKKNADKAIFNPDDIRMPYKADFTAVRTVGGAEYDEDSQLARHEKGKVPESWWDDMSNVSAWRDELVDFPTQKPEALLDRIIRASSNANSIVLDCFGGSGTTAAVAEKLGRRWIVADLNKGALQITIKRLQGVMGDKNGDLIEKNDKGFIHYRVNDYSFVKRDELKKVVIAKYGIETNRNGLFFDGTISGQLAKIIDLDRPLTRLDIQTIKDEIRNNRPDETRDITVFCNGCEMEIITELAKEKNPVNKITVRDIQRDGITTEKPAEADVSITKRGKKAKIKIVDYISPSILARMEIDRTLFNEQVGDFRAQIDCVLIDTDHNGKHFNIVESDIPKKKDDFVRGEYQVSLPRTGAVIAVKIIDMLGEETVIAK